MKCIRVSKPVIPECRANLMLYRVVLPFVRNQSGSSIDSSWIYITKGLNHVERNNDGTYYGKAPAAIVDLKAAVRYIRHNKGLLPGDADYIISTGVSAGGALPGLLAASGNCHLYDAYLNETGAADEPDNIYASACFCPITDLDHADGAYEWMYGDKNSDFVKE
ncbi:MAG: Tat pathway signal sequence domain protein [Bacteroidetes bacterium]|nr:Tat pathway signal sequence domain protein [Bacteroidota bacterium]